MRISIIGSGNVATHLAAAFTNAGHRIVEIWSRNPDNAALLAYHVKALPVKSLSGLNKDIDIAIIAVKDDAIAKVASQLNLQNTLIVHTSGSTDMSVLEGISPAIGVLYPLQTFSKAKSVGFSNLPILIEGNSEIATAQLRELADSVSVQVLEADSKKRLSLHIAAVFACNFSNYLYSLSKKILDQHGLDFNLLRPLIAETADKARQENPENVQTGPAVRNDQETIKKHLAYLETDPDLQKLYSTLSQSIINFYHKP